MGSPRIQDPVGIRHLVEVRFKAQPGIIDHAGALAAAFEGDPFTLWRISNSPFRVELHNRDRSKVAVASVGSVQLEMEAPETYSVFRDHLSRWLRLVTEDRFFGDLEVRRMGFRTWYFAPANGFEFAELAGRVAERLLRVDVLQQSLSSWNISDNSLVLHLADEDRSLHIRAGPIGGDEAKEKRWIMSDSGREALTDLSFAIELDIFDLFEESQAPTRRSLIQFVEEARALAQDVSSALTVLVR